MSWAVLFLVTCAAAGRLVDFLLGTRGRRRTKERLADFYVVVAEGSWDHLARVGTVAIDKFLTNLLGGRLISRKATSRLTAVGMTTDIAVLLAGMVFSKNGGIRMLEIFRIWQFSVAVAIVLASNAVVDTLAYAAARAVYRRALASRSRHVHWRLLFADAVLAYLGVCVTLLIATPLMFVTFTSTSEQSAFWLYPHLLRGLLREVWYRPFASGMTLGNFKIPFLAFSAALPIVLHLLVMSSLIILHISRPLTQRPLKIVLERLDEAPAGVFTTIGVALGTLGALVGAVATALRD